MSVEQAAAAKALGNAAFAKGDFKASIEHFTEAIKHNPQDHVFFSNRSGAHASLQQWDEALADAKKCVELKPDFIKGYNRVFVPLFSQQKYDEAKSIVDEGLKRDPENAALKESKQQIEDAMNPQSKDPMAGLFGPDMWTKLQSDPVTKQHLSDPAYCQKMSQLQQNPKLFSSMTNDPKVAQSLGVLFGLGSSAFSGMSGMNAARQGAAQAAGGDEKIFDSDVNMKSDSDDESHDEEIDTHTKESTQSSSSSQARSPPKSAASPPKAKSPAQPQQTPEQKQAAEAKAQGNEAYKAKKFEEALQHYKKAIELDPKNIVYYNNMAAVHFESKDYDKAIEAAREGLTVGREAMASYKDVAKCYARIGNCYLAQKKYDDAIEAYEKSLLEDHDDKVRASLKRCQEIKKKADEQSYIDPAKSEEHKAAGNAHFANGKWIDAIAEYTEALKRNPNNYKVYSNRAACYSKLMDWHRGIEDCEKCIAADPTFVKAYIRLGKIQLFLKRFDKALQTFERGLAVDPTATELIEGRRQTMMQINTSEADPERAKEAMKDPEIQNILRDPTISKVLQDLQDNPQAGQAALKDTDIRAKIEKLIAAGVLAVK